MWGAAPILFCCARCSGTLVPARRSRSSRRSPHRVAVPSGGGGGVPSAPGGQRAAPVAPQLGGVQGGGRGAAPPPALGPEGEGGEGSGGGPLVPWRRLLTAGGGGGMAVPAPGANHRLRGLRPSPAALYLEPDPRAGPRWGPSSPRPSSRGAGRPGAAVRVSGQRLAGCGAAGSPPRSLSPPSLPREVARSHASCRTVPYPPTLSHPPSGPSPAPPLVWGLVLWRWRVAPAVAPVGEGAPQGPGEPVVGVRIRDAEHRSSFQEGRPRRRPDH